MLKESDPVSSVDLIVVQTRMDKLKVFKIKRNSSFLLHRNEMLSLSRVTYLTLITCHVVRPGAPAEAEQSVARAGTYQRVGVQTASQ